MTTPQAATMTLQDPREVDATRTAGEGGEVDSPQSCSDEIHKWYESYIQTDPRSLFFDSPAILAVETGDLDHERIETAVRREMRTRTVQQGFCKDCQQLLDNWPYFGPEDQSWTVRAGLFDTIELEAGAHNGCRFCGFLFSRHQDAEALDTIRKLEARLEAVGDWTRSSLTMISSVSYAGTPLVSVRINFPGDIPTEHTPAGLADSESEAVDPTGEQRGLLRDGILARDFGMF